MISQALMSSAKETWQTPDHVIEIVRDALGGGIDLDPCASSDPADHFAAQNFTAKDNGLSRKWIGKTYCNPPYGRKVREWIDKCADEFESCRADVIALIPARTDTRAFFRIWESATAVCFWKGRLSFKGAPGPAPFPSAFVYWGDDERIFKHAFRDHGKVVVL